MENLGVENQAQKVTSYAYTFYDADSILSVLIAQGIIGTVIIDNYVYTVGPRLSEYLCVTSMLKVFR